LASLLAATFARGVVHDFWVPTDFTAYNHRTDFVNFPGRSADDDRRNASSAAPVGTFPLGRVRLTFDIRPSRGMALNFAKDPEYAQFCQYLLDFGGGGGLHGLRSKTVCERRLLCQRRLCHRWMCYCLL
jgi:hypothetical protein